MAQPSRDCTIGLWCSASEQTPRFSFFFSLRFVVLHRSAEDATCRLELILLCCWKIIIETFVLACMPFRVRVLMGGVGWLSWQWYRCEYIWMLLCWEITSKFICVSGNGISCNILITTFVFNKSYNLTYEKIIWHIAPFVYVRVMKSLPFSLLFHEERTSCAWRAKR